MDSNVGTVVVGRFHEVDGRANRVPGHLGQLLCGKFGISVWGVDPSADGGAAQVDLYEKIASDIKPVQFSTDVVRVPVKLLTQSHGDSILQLGASHLQHIGKLLGLGIETICKVGDGLFQPLQQGVHPEPEPGGVGVIGRLGLVDVIVGMDDVIGTLRVSQHFESQVGDDLVGVHVDRGSRSPLEGISRELVHTAPIIQDRIACGDNGVSDITRKNLQLLVRQSCRLLHLNHSTNEVRLVVHASA